MTPMSKKSSNIIISMLGNINKKYIMNLLKHFLKKDLLALDILTIILNCLLWGRNICLMLLFFSLGQDQSIYSYAFLLIMQCSFITYNLNKDINKQFTMICGPIIMFLIGSALFLPNLKEIKSLMICMYGIIKNLLEKCIIKKLNQLMISLGNGGYGIVRTTKELQKSKNKI